MNLLQFYSFSGSVLFWLLACNPTAAEIVPDTTLPVNSTTTPQGDTRVIEGGTLRSGNLFHSFREFSFSVLTGDTTGDTVFFNNDLSVRNIITRVTGGSPSNIDGVIRANGTANLFFVNPNGIVFGPNASLNVGGSFVASTANSLKFADGTEFSATAPETSPLLTVSVPLGLQFGLNPGEIVNQSQASPNEAVNSFDAPVGLQVQNGKTLALVGGNVSLQAGNLTAAGGRIELGSVAEDGFVNLSQIESGYAFEYADIQNFGDVQLSQGAFVDTSDSGGGAIQLQGRNITLTENSLILSSTFGSITGGNLVINAAESVQLSGGSNIATFAEGEAKAGDVLVRGLDSIELVGTASDGSPSALASQVCAISLDCQSVTGNGGDLTLETRRLLIQDGAVVDASTFGAGRAGNVLLRASDDIELVGATADGAAYGIFAQVAQGAIESAGDAGTLTIETERLTVMDGAQISTAARTGGNGGSLTINASDSIRLSGISPTAPPDSASSGLFVSAEPGATSNAGDLNVNTGKLIVEDGAKISADNFGTGQGGNATLNVRQLIIQNGGLVGAGSFDEGPGGTLTVKASEFVQVSGPGTIGSMPVDRTLFTQSEASGAAGNLNITTESLKVRDGAIVTVSGAGSGNAGNLEVTARSIHLDNQATFTGNTTAGQGNIILRSKDLILRRSSNITTNATGTATGGNVTIDSDIVAALGNSDISANAQEAFGGRVIVNAQGIFGTEFREAETSESDITATSALGPQFSGTVQINTPDTDPSSGLVALPTNLVDASGLIAQACRGSGRAIASEQDQFVVTGRGGLPPSPSEALSTQAVWQDWRPPAQQIANRSSGEVSSSKSDEQRTPQPLSSIVEAQGWIVSNKGEVVLTAQAPTVTPRIPWLSSTACHD